LSKNQQLEFEFFLQIDEQRNPLTETKLPLFFSLSDTEETRTERRKRKEPEFRVRFIFDRPDLASTVFLFHLEP
jgi:hypothetical protein